MPRYLLLVVVALGGLGAAACGTTAPAARTGATSKTTVPLPAGRLPSAISKQVCAGEAQKDIGETLGVTAVVQTPTWVDHLYSCRYQYPNGSMVLSVKEL